MSDASSNINETLHFMHHHTSSSKVVLYQRSAYGRWCSTINAFTVGRDAGVVMTLKEFCVEPSTFNSDRLRKLTERSNHSAEQKKTKEAKMRRSHLKAEARTNMVKLQREIKKAGDQQHQKGAEATDAVEKKDETIVRVMKKKAPPSSSSSQEGGRRETGKLRHQVNLPVR